MEVKLSKRMSALAALVTPGMRLADVGTDHGYIPVWLCQRKVIPSAIAMDINPGPLKRAKEHIIEYHLTDKIETRLSDGLERLRSDEADVILIAGMGGGLIQRILSEGSHALGGVKELILQPQSEIANTRRFLREHGFQIVDEDMVEEDGKFYPMMKAVRLSDKLQGIDAHMPFRPCAGENLQKLNDTFGPVLLSRKHPVLLRWLERESGITDNILSRLNTQIETKSAQPAENPFRDQLERVILRREELSGKKKLLQQAMDQMRGK